MDGATSAATIPSKIQRSPNSSNMEYHSSAIQVHPKIAHPKAIMYSGVYGYLRIAFLQLQERKGKGFRNAS
jgi:hypothetical protein